MKIYVKGGIVYWLLDGQDEENENVLTTDQELGLIKETNTEELLAYLKTEDGADLLEPVKIAPELCYILDDSDNAILADDTTGLIAKRGLERREFVIYSEDDNSLIFYASHENVPRTGSQYNEKTVTNVYTNFLDTEYTEDNLPQWHEVCELIKSVSFDESFAKVKPSYTAYWFYGMINCTSIDTENLDTSQVTDMHDMFSELESMEELNVNNLDVRNVKTMYGIFYDCIKLTTIDISNWQTDSLTNVHGMFDSCSCLVTLDVSNLDTSKVTDMQRMFYECSDLETIYSDDDVFVTDKVTSSNNMFTDDTNLVGGNGTKFDSSHIDASYAHVDVESNPGYFTDKTIKAFAVYSEDDNSLTFYSDEKVPASGEKYNNKTVTNTYRDMDTSSYSSGSSVPWYSHRGDIKSVSFDSSFAEIKPISMAYWFYYFDNCTSFSFTNLDTSNVTNMRDMFSYCRVLTSLDVSKFDTSNVTNMSYMFYYCNSLTSLDVSKFNTSNVTNMGAMFDNCSSLTSLDVSKFDTSNVTNMRYIFDNCSSLTSLDISNFNTSNVTNMGDMFYACRTLTSLDVSKFDTSNVTNMGSMFSYCYALTSLDVSKFNTSNVTDMTFMFDNCYALTSLDVSKFDTSNVTEMQYMFFYCNSLTTIYSDDSNFVTSAVTSDSNMFSNCSSLVGGNGTKYSSSKVDSSMAHVDTSSNPGYFTKK